MSRPSEGSTVADDPPTRSEDERRPFSERLERSRTGRILLGVFLAATLVGLLVINAPASVTKRGLMTVAGPYLSALGLEQGWGVFSPNPRPFSLEVEARILDRDGTTRVAPITADRGLGEYTDYRWQRWADRMATGPDNQAMWAPYCQWLAAQERDAGRHPIRIALVNHRADTLPPGPGPSHGPTTEREFFAIGVRP
jgi:hypothetical protein